MEWVNSRVSNTIPFSEDTNIYLRGFLGALEGNATKSLLFATLSTKSKYTY